MERTKTKPKKVGVQPNGKILSNGKQLFSVPNTDEGHLFIALARKYANTELYKVGLKGRGPKEGTKSDRHGEVKVGDSEWLALYMQNNYERLRPKQKS